MIYFQVSISIVALLVSLGCENSTDSNTEVVDDILVDEEPVNDENYSFIYNNKKYTLVKEASTWDAAVSYAIENNGYLAEINDEGEQTAIFSEFIDNANITLDETNNQFKFAAVWLGGNDVETEGVWVWNGNNRETEEQFWEGGVDGIAINELYNNWGNEPDNNGDQDALCIGLEATPINAAGKWTDLKGNDNNLFFLIEYDE